MEAVRRPLSEVNQASRNITVVVALPETTSAVGDVRYKKLLFRDKTGSEISATLFNDDIELFSDVFHAGKDYEITNSVISPVREEVRRGSQNFQMIIRSTTKVVELAPSVVGNHSYIVPLASAIEYLDHPGRIDIVGLAVHVTSPRKVRRRQMDTEFDARDIILVDTSMRPKKLTLWQTFVSGEAQTIADIAAARPVVLATRVSVSRFGGSNWSTTFFSTVHLDYNGPEAVTLRQWEGEHSEEIARITEEAQSDVGETSRTILPIAALGLQEDGAILWIKGHVTHVINSDRCVYSSCSVCNTGTDVPVGETFSCFQTTTPHITPHIGTPHIGTSVYRCNLQIHFDDESSAIKLTLFHELAEKVLKKTAAQISCLSHEERLSMVSDFVDSIRGRLFVLKLLAKQIGYSIKQLRFNVQHVEEVEE